MGCGATGNPAQHRCHLSLAATRIDAPVQSDTTKMGFVCSAAVLSVAMLAACTDDPARTPGNGILSAGMFGSCCVSVLAWLEDVFGTPACILLALLCSDSSDVASGAVRADATSSRALAI